MYSVKFSATINIKIKRQLIHQLLRSKGIIKKILNCSQRKQKRDKQEHKTHCTNNKHKAKGSLHVSKMIITVNVNDLNTPN